QAQLDDARHQLDSAEKEKSFLSEKLQATQQRSAQPQEEKKRHEAGARKPGVRGNVLAVNQAYNFVVLNLGARQGVEPNSEMLVLREGTLIGKIRISSVEPATAIGDIITSSWARGVQVQPEVIVCVVVRRFSFRGDYDSIGNACVLVDNGPVDHAIAPDSDWRLPRLLVSTLLEIICPHHNAVSDRRAALNNTAYSNDAAL